MEKKKIVPAFVPDGRRQQVAAEPRPVVRQQRVNGTVQVRLELVRRHVRVVAIGVRRRGVRVRRIVLLLLLMLLVLGGRRRAVARRLQRAVCQYQVVESARRQAEVVETALALVIRRGRIGLAVRLLFDV